MLSADPTQETRPGRVAVLGAGIAGLSAADRLVDAGFDVVVIEAGSRVGGTHRSEEIGPYTFDVGSIFYEANARIFQLADGLADLCPTVRRIQRRIDQTGAVVHYPMEPRDILDWPAGLRLRALRDLVVHRATVRRDGSLDAICRKRLGRTFYEETGLRDYITRFNHVPPADIHEEFFFHRMAFIANATELRGLTRAGSRLFGRRTPIRPVRPELHVRPRAGYDVLFASIRAALEARGVGFMLNTSVERIKRGAHGEMHIETTAGTEIAETVVGALPLDHLHRALFGEGSGLVSIDLMTLFVSATELHPETGNVFFNFSPGGRWKRATIYSRIYPEPATTRAFFSVEVTLPPGATPDPEAAFADMAAHFDVHGLARGLRLEGHTEVPGAYPLYTRTNPNQAQAVRARVLDAGVLPVGRQGAFEYLPTSTGVIRRVGEELSRHLPAVT